MAGSQASAAADYFTADNDVNKDNNRSPPDTLPPPKYDELQTPSYGYHDAYPPAYSTGYGYGNNIASPGWTPLQATAYHQQLPVYTVSSDTVFPPVSTGRESVSGVGHVIVIQQPAPADNVPVGKAFRCHLVAACLVFWFCGWGFGGLAYGLAVGARSSLSAGRSEEARKLGVASAWVSIAALITGLIAWAFIIWAIVVDVLEEN